MGLHIEPATRSEHFGCWERERTMLSARSSNEACKARKLPCRLNKWRHPVSTAAAWPPTLRLSWRNIPIARFDLKKGE
jgi:hypothetical protein